MLKSCKFNQNNLRFRNSTLKKPDIIQPKTRNMRNNSTDCLFILRTH